MSAQEVVIDKYCSTIDVKPKIHSMLRLMPLLTTQPRNYTVAAEFDELNQNLNLFWPFARSPKFLVNLVLRLSHSTSTYESSNDFILKK